MTNQTAAKAGAWPTAWQLGMGLAIFSQSLCHQGRWLGGTANFSVVFRA